MPWFGIVYSIATGRALREIGPVEQTAELFRNSLRPGEQILVASDLEHEGQSAQELVTAETGLHPEGDRFVELDAPGGNAIDVHIIDLALDKPNYPDDRFLPHSEAGPGWWRLNNLWFNPPVIRPRGRRRR